MFRTAQTCRAARAGRTAVAAVLQCAVVLSAALLAPATAGAARAADPGVTHPEQDTAGSTIRAHEGGDLTAADQPSALRTPGFDASDHQSTIDWAAAYRQGARFAYLKASEGTGYTSRAFRGQYDGSAQTGLIRGAYHFALPNVSGGARQADYFVDHGGGWSRDGRTLPPMLDIEYNPYGPTCYGLTPAAMRSWLDAFRVRVHARTSRFPTIYTSTAWWTQCTGNWSGLGGTDPLFLARYASDPGPLPHGWTAWTIWQFNDHGTYPGDQDAFSGGLDRVRALATG